MISMYVVSVRKKVDIFTKYRGDTMYFSLLCNTPNDEVEEVALSQISHAIKRFGDMRSLVRFSFFSGLYVFIRLHSMRIRESEEAYTP